MTESFKKALEILGKELAYQNAHYSGSVQITENPAQLVYDVEVTYYKPLEKGVHKVHIGQISQKLVLEYAKYLEKQSKPGETGIIPPSYWATSYTDPAKSESLMYAKLKETIEKLANPKNAWYDNLNIPKKAKVEGPKPQNMKELYANAHLKKSKPKHLKDPIKLQATAVPTEKPSNEPYHKLDNLKDISDYVFGDSQLLMYLDKKSK